MANNLPHDHVIPPALQLQLTQFAMDRASIGIYWVGPDARICYANNHACAMLGYTRSELLGKSIPDLDPNYPMSRWREHWQSLMRDGTQSFETVHRRRDGTTIPVEIVANYVRLDHHEYNVGFARDISERKRAESELLEQEEFFRMISENVDDFIAVLDLQGRRLYNNPLYSALFPVVQSLKGTDSFREVHPDDRERIKALFRETVETGIGRRAEFRFVRADGGIRDMESSGRLIRNDSGEPLRVVVVSHDVTERKRAEAMIHELAFHDALTRLPNRRLLRDRLEQMMALSQRSGLYNALMFLDMDGFKPLNDLHGHDAGDALLVEVASRLKSCVREMDTVARFGGDEFLVLLDELGADPARSKAKAALVAEKIRATLAEPYRITVRRKGKADAIIAHHTTASIGVVLFINHHTAEEITGHADKAMYRSKEAGGNQVSFHPGTVA